MKISRQAYADMYGPTVGDKVRLADTELFVEVEQDFTVYGEEVKFGGGKVIRDGQGQSQLLAHEVVDTLITNALIIDHWHRQGRRRLEEWPHPRDWQSRQPGHPARRDHGHRRQHRSDCR